MASPNLKCRLSEWGLPPLIVSWFRKKGITSLFEWQVECLCKNDVLVGGNLVYSAPTSAGKTLVADFLLIKKVLEYQKKALVIEPFVALTREKALTLKSMLYSTKARVGAFGGNYYTPGGLAAISVAVCTIEKANGFINKLVTEGKLGDLGIIVVDEIHYLGDERRGHQLELLLTKVLFYNQQQQESKRIQIVGLSATIPNLESIAVWLNASLYVTSYRPVPLVEKIKIDDKIYEVNSFLKNNNCEPLEIIESSQMGVDRDNDDLRFLCFDSITKGFSTLVFCESKRQCEVMAADVAEQIQKIGNNLSAENVIQRQISKKLRENLSKPKILDLIDKLKKCPAGPDKELMKSIGFGVAFHHAGLTSEEREIIEDGFKGGAIKTLMATSTLSSGVNLPARRVIIKSPTAIYSGNSTYQVDMLNPITYRQMIGRAGRKNIDSSGESILICRPDNQDIAIKLIKASLGDINSSLANRMIASEGEPSGLKKAVLEVIANNTAKTRVRLDQYLKSTYWLSDTTKKQENEFREAITKTLRYLVLNKFIEELKPGEYKSTRLGNAVLASGLHPDESLELLQDLIKARQGFCLLNDLHIIYQVTPNDVARSIDLKDWQHFSKIWNDLDETCQYVGQRVGIDEVILARRCQGYTASMDEDKERIYKRFWIALVINDLVSEMQLPKICFKYRVSKAMVQQVQRSVAQFAGVMSIFCAQLGYDNIAALVTPLESRINFSCQRDLLELIRLNITRPIARALFKAGYQNPIAVAKGDKLDIEFTIRQIKPFKKDLSFNSELSHSPLIWVPELAASMTTLDYASHIVDTARNYVEIEYDIDLGLLVDRGKGERNFTSQVPEIERHNERRSVKRGRLEEGPNLGDKSNDSLESGEAIMRRGDVPNVETVYVSHEERNVNTFMDKWIRHSSVSLNFKLDQYISKPIGAKVKRLSKRQKKTRTPLEADQSTSADSLENQDEEESSSESSDDSQPDGLTLHLDVDNKKHVVSRLYACFDDDFRVYIVDTKQALLQIKDRLQDFLTNSYSCVVAQTASQNKQDFSPIKLYTQNIILTYQVLHTAFELSQVLLNKHFEWHSFDVAWWMVNDCPNRGLNNRNSSLSLVARTKWAAMFHHFLHPSDKRSRRRRISTDQPGTSKQAKRDEAKFMLMKDQVKAGKTAILQPLIKEILVELQRRNQTVAYYEAEIPSRLTMAQMIIHGIGLNMKNISSELTLYQNLLQQLTDIAQKFYAKSSISLTNNRHVARVLYECLDLKKHLLNHSTNSDIAKEPTNSEILTILSKYHPFPKLVQDFRRIGKALDALQAVNTHARFNDRLNMMRVIGQCDFWQLTGRVSMSDPDLFLINRNFTVHIPAHGAREEETVICAPRRCFTPINSWVFIAADYSQLELRLLAHFSEDRNLLEILNRSLGADETYDVFKTMAARVYRVEPDEITDEQRQHAKQICYGIIYGMGNKSLAIQLGVDADQAENFRQDLFNAFPGIRSYTSNLIKNCEESGYVESLLGRRRPVDGLESEHSSTRSRAERVAINTRIQASASDIIKLAMSAVNQKVLASYADNVRLVLEMHDELIYEINPVILDRFARMLKYCMEDVADSRALKVKLLVNLKKGNDWSQLNKFQLCDTKLHPK